MTAAADNALVLVVEDEPRLAAVLRDYLHAAGYRSAWVADGDAVLDAVAAHGPALVLLDLMLPGRDGVDVCRALRAVSQVPVIMVTARVEEIDRLLGLEVGADDYICKPFSPKEVIARVGAVLRRVRQGQPEPPIPGLTIDQANGRALLHGQALDLTAVEFRLLRTLLGAPGRVWSRERLLDHLYVDHRVVADRTVDSHVRNLRRKLHEAGLSEDPIRSIYGMGYRLEV
ncbi:MULTISPECIES: response regulator [Pseudoxanthomonas]|uniref:Two-component system response regulator BaeR n=1 Tax=Pseudoxanthomonas winnipegensis TaxID=2480810 RepID=A0AAW8GF24_9GAMM|nr:MULTISPECIES: response regulator [Pseudoxanthomonas]MDQ1120984.1 two-component system response regulator BaeR [Pseudoxanthomonas winnipegensis]MDR6139551.1 two-component system response regulator BaeR [Pseudoxanthomonas sp. SORGH_AS_0997]